MGRRRKYKIGNRYVTFVEYYNATHPAIYFRVDLETYKKIIETFRIPENYSVSVWVKERILEILDTYTKLDEKRRELERLEKEIEEKKKILEEINRELARKQAELERFYRMLGYINP